MVAHAGSRRDTGGVQAIREQGLKGIQICYVSPVGHVAAEDHHLGSGAQGEDGVHNGSENIRGYRNAISGALGVAHPNETL